MGKPKYDIPTNTFPYKIPKRLNILSVPRKYIIDTGEGMPAFTCRGIRMSALRGLASDRITDVAWPYIRRFLLTKKQCKKQFTPERMQNIDKMIELTNATCYSKLANCTIDLKRDAKEVKKKKGWSESDWKKHMDYIGQISGPRPSFQPPPVKRGPRKNLVLLMPRITMMSVLPESKVYRRPSQEDWYKNPMKVSPAAMKYVITDRMRKLAKPKEMAPQE